MTTAELNILALFRRYMVGPAEMLFINAQDCRIDIDTFASATLRLVEKDLIVEERPNQAFSLTPAGYRIACTAQMSTA
jgi:hypothetical protein